MPAGQEAQATRIYAAALSEKLEPMLGGVDRIVRVLAPVLVTERCVCALQDGEVAGLAGYWMDGTGLYHPGWRAFVKEYGLLSGSVRRLGLLLLEGSRDTDSLLLDGIAVRPSARGQGAGTRLLAEIKQIAGEHGKARVRLDVIDTNKAARRLYERNGFKAGQAHSISWLRFIFPFRSVTSMTCETRYC
jgi:ribosomal protein S18 acetylase RimI-like enzyme